MNNTRAASVLDGAAGLEVGGGITSSPSLNALQCWPGWTSSAGTLEGQEQEGCGGTWLRPRGHNRAP